MRAIKGFQGFETTLLVENLPAYHQLLVPIIRTVPIISTVLIYGGSYCSFSLLHYSSYCMYCLKKKIDRTVNFHYCTALPIIRTFLKKTGL